MRLGTTLFLILLVASVPLAAAPAISTSPGEINHIEGFALLNGRQLADGSASSELIGDGGLLVTAAGYAEVLLDPGVFLRVGPNAAVRFETIHPNQISMQLERGEVLIDAAAEPGGRISIQCSSLKIAPSIPGLYELDGNACRAQIYAGAAEVRDATGTDFVHKGEQAGCNTGVQKFDSNRADALYVWSSRVAEYEAAASYGGAYKLAANDTAPSWRWDDVLHCWGYVPREGVVADPLGWSYAASARELRKALILNGPRIGYPALVDRRNPPRILSTPSPGGTVDLARARRVHPPHAVVPWNPGPGPVGAPIPGAP